MDHLTVLILALTAAGALWSAWASQQSAKAAREAIIRSEDRTRQLQTMKLINETEASEVFLNRADVFRRHRDGGTLTNLTNPMDTEARRERLEVLGMLNHYELLSLSIKTGLLDEGIYRTWMESVFVRDWNGAAAFIDAERRKSAGGDVAIENEAPTRPIVIHQSTRLDEDPVIDEPPAADEEARVTYNSKVFAEFEAMAHRWDPQATRIGPNIEPT